MATSNLLTAFMLGGWIALSPAAFAASGNYGVHSGVVTGSARIGELRMAGTVPVASRLKTYAPNQRRWNQPTHFQSRHNGGSAYANLNQ